MLHDGAPMLLLSKRPGRRTDRHEFNYVRVLVCQGVSVVSQKPRKQWPIKSSFAPVPPGEARKENQAHYTYAELGNKRRRMVVFCRGPPPFISQPLLSIWQILYFFHLYDSQHEARTPETSSPVPFLHFARHAFGIYTAKSNRAGLA